MVCNKHLAQYKKIGLPNYIFLFALHKYLRFDGRKIKSIYLISYSCTALETNLHMRKIFLHRILNYHQKDLTRLQDIQTGLVEGQTNGIARITIFPIKATGH